MMWLIEFSFNSLFMYVCPNIFDLDMWLGNNCSIINIKNDI